MGAKLFRRARELRHPDSPPAEHLDLLTRHAGGDVAFLAAQPMVQRRQGGQPDRGRDGQQETAIGEDGNRCIRRVDAVQDQGADQTEVEPADPSREAAPARRAGR